MIYFVVFANAGDEKPDYLPGDVRFILRTTPHSKFIREGDNLRYKLTITLLEVCYLRLLELIRKALVGFTKEIKHLDGHKVQVVRDTVTKPGSCGILLFYNLNRICNYHYRRRNA